MHFFNHEAARADAELSEERTHPSSEVDPNVAPPLTDVAAQPEEEHDNPDTCGSPAQPSAPSQLQAKVYLYMYDLFGGRNFGRILLGKKFKALWHTGIVVEWPDNTCEIWYDNQIFLSPPGQTPFRAPDEKRLLGTTLVSHVTMIEYLASCEAEWTGKYDLARRNCVHFSDWVARSLHLAALPDELVGQAAEVMQTPVARLVLGILHVAERLRRRK